MDRISPDTNPDKTGDLVEPWDQFWAGTIPLSDLSPSEQAEARALLSGSG